MEQVVVNLAVNARDAMPNGGSLSIEVANVLVDAHHAEGRPGLEQGRYVRLRVSDTGTGMDEAVRDRVFEPFFTTKERGSGTGLGLATVYGIVARASGVINVYSELGLGTTFTILFPATDVPEDDVEGHALAPATQLAASRTILVVEDDRELRAVGERILVGAGYEVLTAEDGDTALAIAASRPEGIDLVITDVVMPGMLGTELVHRLQEAHPGLRVLLMSGYAPPVLRSGGTLPAGTPLLDKPFSGPVLIAKVREVLEAPPPYLTSS